MLGKVDPRDVIYTMTRLRTPWTDRSLRRPPHRKKCMRTAHCFIGRHPGTGSSFIRCPVSSRTIQCLAEGHLGSRRPLRVLPLTPTHRRLHLEWCHTRGNWTAVEWNQVVFSDESRFNISSDDNRVRVWRPRGERRNPAFCFTASHHSHSWCDDMGCHSLQYTIAPSIDSWNHDSPVVCPLHPAAACVATHATASRSHFSTRQCSASHGKGVTRLYPHYYYPSFACPIPRFVPNQAYLG
ncbi:uncharacterized protein TNCV_476991 [Trichonephila clavipes]|nr:uncharacterized protein TNCV_476991 [Trichonephila clavipes]